MENTLTGQASEWLSRRQRGPLPPEELHAFETWLDASPYHAVAYARVEATWERAQRLQAAPQAWTLQTPRPPVRPWWRPALAAALLLVTVGGGVWMLSRTQDYHTAVGERRTVVLADGSRVELNTASKLRVDYSDRRRDVRLLSGEALFHVSKDPQRPFVVHAGDAAVRAVGTAFNLRLRGRGMVELTVTEGIVAVEGGADIVRRNRAAGDAPRTIEAGQGALLGEGAVAKLSLDGEALQRRTAWQRDLIELRGETLERAVAEFNRYRATPMVVGDPDIASMRVGGTFATDESGKFVAALQSGFAIQAVEGTDGTLYLVAAQP